MAGLLVGKHRLGRQAYSEGFVVPSSPADSGYGSPSVTPEKQHAPRTPLELRYYPFFDGNGSSEVLRSLDDDTSPEPVLPAEIDIQKSATLPRQNRAVRPGLPVSFFSNGIPKLARRCSDAGPSPGPRKALRHPDRFVPSRDAIPPSPRNSASPSSPTS